METRTFVHNKPSVLSGVIAFIPPLTRITETTNTGAQMQQEDRLLDHTCADQYDSASWKLVATTVAADVQTDTRG